MRLFSGFVLAFHDIPPQRLCELVEAMRPAQAVSLSELVKRSREGKSTSGLFAITVDDGVGETVRTLAQVFTSRGWPGTFYLATDYLDSGEAMPFQYLRQLLPWLPRRKLKVNHQILDLSAPDALQQLARDMEHMWHTKKRDVYLPLTHELAQIAINEHGLSLADLHLPSPVSWAEVKALSRNPIISFESHGVSHAAMSAMTRQELVYEMKHSQERVSEHTSRPCRHLAYPFGSDDSIGADAVEVAQDYYDSAVTMKLGHVDAANPYLLPRIPLYSKNSTLVARLKILLKCIGRDPSGWSRPESPLEAELEKHQSASAGRRTLI
jgi:peptidoglycan/xylan/chitin deacetylase (PgdA/CDA1 family)